MMAIRAPVSGTTRVFAAPARNTAACASAGTECTPPFSTSLLAKCFFASLCRVPRRQMHHCAYERSRAIITCRHQPSHRRSAAPQPCCTTASLAVEWCRRIVSSHCETGVAVDIRGWIVVATYKTLGFWSGHVGRSTQVLCAVDAFVPSTALRQQT